MKTFTPLVDDINMVVGMLESIARTLREATHPEHSCKAARDIAVDAQRTLLMQGPAATEVLALAARCETFEREKHEDDDEVARITGRA